jgi:thiol:disulfide interchange protein DsbC
MSHFLNSRATVAVIAAFMAGACFAQAEKPAPMTAEALAIKKVLEQKFPGAEIKGVTKTGYLGGLYEVQLDDRILYTDAKAKHIMIGAMYDTEAKVNLTEERQRKLNRVNVASIPLDMAIKKVKGNGSRTMYVFSDADCPFCARLEQELKNVDNVTIYTFLYPIDSLHPDAARKSRVIWCSPDRLQAWDAYYDSGKLPENAGDCDNPVAKTVELGAKYKVNATPTLIFADGTVIAGALPAAKLESEINNAEAEAKKPAAAKKS